MRVLIAGGTGFLGSRLAEALLRDDHEVFILTRQSVASFGSRPFRLLSWPLTSESDIILAQSCTVVVNLAGESIGGKKWTADQKNKIQRSRVGFTKELTDVLRGSTQLKVFISSSAIGYYGNRNAEVLNEDSPRGEGFLADVCAEWENAAHSLAHQPDIRTVLLRTGVVLSRNHGILAELEPLYQNGLGGRVGHGRQMISWIHFEDWIRAVQLCISNTKIAGPVNLVAPEPVAQNTFSAVMNELLRQSIKIPASAAMIKLMLGEMSALALDSQNVRPEKLLHNNFKFMHPYLSEALKSLFYYEKNKGVIYNYFSTTTWLPQPLDTVFNYFADERNLEKMTPPDLEFQVLKKSTSSLMKGTLIDYKLKVHGLPMKWRTLISAWNPPHGFSDQQLIGPYSFWDHTHKFESLGKGTLMTDEVHYRLPLGIWGRIFGHGFVKKDLNKIFSFRKKVLFDAVIGEESTATKDIENTP